MKSALIVGYGKSGNGGRYINSNLLGSYDECSPQHADEQKFLLKLEKRLGPFDEVVGLEPTQDLDYEGLLAAGSGGRFRGVTGGMPLKDAEVPDFLGSEASTNGPYDLVALPHVLWHVAGRGAQPDEAMRQLETFAGTAAKLLKPDGKLLVVEYRNICPDYESFRNLLARFNSTAEKFWEGYGLRPEKERGWADNAVELYGKAKK